MFRAGHTPKGNTSPAGAGGGFEGHYRPHFLPSELEHIQQQLAQIQAEVDHYRAARRLKRPTPKRILVNKYKSKL